MPPGPGRRGRGLYALLVFTRDFGNEITTALPDLLAACQLAGFDLLLVETSGIGQATRPSSRTSMCRSM